MLDKENESAVADKKREAIKGRENDCIKEEDEKEKVSMLCSYDDLFYGVLPLDNNCTQKPLMIPPKTQQLHYIIREEESINLSHSWLSRSVSFDKQFWWDKLLEPKLGMSWACHIDLIFGQINWGKISLATIEEDHQRNIPNFWSYKLGENMNGYYRRRLLREEINDHHQRT